MSDLLHEDVPTEFILEVFRVMNETSRHTFQVLTKRSKRLVELAPRLRFTPNIWMGVSVETPRYLWRAADLRRVPAHVRFLSIEPLLARFDDLPLKKIDWVIVGGESGPGARPMRASWIRDIRRACRRDGVAFFFKQWGGVQKSRAGRELDGRTYDAMPLPIVE